MIMNVIKLLLRTGLTVCFAASSWFLFGCVSAQERPRRLSEAEVIAIAEDEAKLQHYDIQLYEPGKARYRNGRWRVFFYGKPEEGSQFRALGRNFSAIVDDRSRTATISFGR
jgi:hypothetical protein